MTEQLALLPGYLSAHVRISLLALLAGIGLSLPLGVLASRLRWLEQPVMGIAGVIQTIPGLALLAVTVPALAALNLPSIGFLPAFLGLVLYSMLPVLRNTVVGLAAVDPAVLEAAQGVGMTPGQRLLRVELPLALPVILAGVRISTVWTVGMATLSTPVGATSLGNYIFSGLQTRNPAAVLTGCIAAAALAIVLDGLVHLAALGWERRRRGLLAAAATALAALYLFAGISLARDFLAAKASRIRIGAKTFTEQYILSAILAGQIERETGIPVELAQSLGSTVVFDALRSGDIDAYVDYSGTIWATVMHRGGEGTTRAEVLATVERYLREQAGIAVACALGFENAYALAMRRETAERLGVRRISDLAPHARALSIGGDYEFFSRAEWKALEAAYGLVFATRRSMDPSLMYQAVARRNVDVISAYSTDGRIAALDLVVLEDDRGAIPPYDAIVLASAGLLQRHPQAFRALQALGGKVDAIVMRRMNLAVDEQGQSPAAVARAFLDKLPGP